MPRDRIKLSDAKALIASGQSPEKIAANFDVEDDSGPTTPQPANPSTPAAARIANVVRAKGVARYPGDPISQIEARKANPPEAQLGDPNAEKGTTTAGDVLGAVGHGLGGIVHGALTMGLDEPEPEDIPPPPVNDTKAQTFLRERVPIAGDIAADVAKP